MIRGERIMLLLSQGARQLIDAAVEELGDPTRKEVWRAWAAAHPRARRAGDFWDDGGPPLPHDVVEAALLALNEATRRKRSRIEAASSEDEISDLDNDLSHIKAVARLLREGPPAVRLKVPTEG
jgi:hypothetical protein